MVTLQKVAIFFVPGSPPDSCLPAPLSRNLVSSRVLPSPFDLHSPLPSSVQPFMQNKLHNKWYYWRIELTVGALNLS